MTDKEYTQLLSDIEFVKLSIKLEQNCEIREELIEELQELRKKL